MQTAFHNGVARAVAAVVVAVAPVAFVVHPVYGCDGSSRRVGAYIDYTFRHLPNREVSPPLPRNPEARLASFAARIAFSSFTIRSWAR